MVERILVPFEGEGSGVEGLTWGQIGLWQSTLADGRSRTTGGTAPTPPGTTVEWFADMLRFMVSRHQALRTRLVFDKEGTARQSCSTSGELPLEIYDAGDRAPAELAAEIEGRYQSTNFAYETEWPVRMAGIRVGDEIVHMVAVYHHLVIDADGARALIADLLTRDPVTGTAGPVTGIPPLEQARRQRTPAARRQSAASLRHLERVFRTMSISRFGEPRKDGGPDCRSGPVSPDRSARWCR